MTLLNIRDLLSSASLPPGDNANDTIIGNVHFNKTTLDFWNYTLYSNGTLSNGSWCILTFQPYTPALVLPNGTFVNSSSCWTPTEPIAVRGGLGIAFAVLFGVALVLNLVNLTKHGKLHLPAEKRFYPIGRRWQWYWGSFTCAAAVISGFTSIDVDRYYLPELPIVLTSFFWFLMQLGVMALVWEAVRHWGSWMERQFIDPDPFILRNDDRRSRVEFYIPLVFYLFWWLNFFMIVPRSWTNIEYQRYPQQTIDDAAPTATDARFKTAAFLLVACWLITVFSLRHSIKHYCPRNRGVFNRIRGFLRYTPLRFLLILPLAAVVPAYQALVAFDFDYSPLKVTGNRAAIYAGGYLPTLLILYVQAAFGFFNPNEDLELQRQRRVRDQEINREMGLVAKPSWWRRVNGENLDMNATMRERLAQNVRELQGGSRNNNNNNNGNGNGKPAPLDTTTTTTAGTPGLDALEMTPVSPPPPLASPTSSLSSPPLTPYTGRSEQRRQERAQEMAAGLLFPQGAPGVLTPAQRRAELMMDGPMPMPPPPSYRDAVTVAGQAVGRGAQGVGGGQGVARSISADSAAGSVNQPPQQIRSMLDV